MDRVVEKPGLSLSKKALIAVALTVLVGGTYSLFAGTTTDSLRVEWDRLTVAEVIEGNFEEYILVSGVAQPRQSIFLDVVVGGRVEEVMVREGETVVEGQPLLRLVNNDLQLRLLSAETQRIEQVHQLEDFRSRIKRESLERRQELSDMDYQIQRLERQDRRNQVLLDEQLIAQQDFEATRDELEFYRRQRELTLESFEQDSLRQETQLQQMETSLKSMEENSAVTRKILDSLVVRAPMTGQLTALDAQPGQLLSSGKPLGQIDAVDGGFRVRAQIDEYYIDRVAVGQTARLEERGETGAEVTVRRIFPEVREGKFEVELDFTGDSPEGLRRGQSVRCRLQLGGTHDALLVPRDRFYHQTGGHWIYVVSGDHAERRDIRLGRRNPEHFEVLDGLAPGEQVVISGYEDFGNAARLVAR